MFFLNENVPTWLIVVQLVEFVLLCIFITIGWIAALAILKHRLFHSNLRLLINIIGFSWFSLTFTRIISLIDQFVFPEAILSNYILILEWPHIIPEAGRTMSVALGLSGSIMMLLERVIASIFLDSYEHRTDSILVLFGVASTLPFTGLMAYFIFYEQYGYIVALTSGLITLFMIAMFVFVDRWNRRRLDMAIKHGLNYNLSQRFQLSENIRASNIIYKAMLTCCGGSIIVVILFASYRFTHTSTEIFILRAIFNLYTCCFSFAVILLAVSQTHPWRTTFIHKMFLIWYRFRRVKIENEGVAPNATPVVRNIDGIQLAFNQRDEAAMYFKQLDELWT